MKYIHAFKTSDGYHAYGPSMRENTTKDFLSRYKANAEKHAGEPVALFVCDEMDAPVGGQKLKATISNGTVVGTPIDSTKEVWLHFSLGGGDGSDPIGAPTSGATPIVINAVLRESESASSATVAANRDYILTVRSIDNSAYDVRKIKLVNGVMVPANYSGNANGAPGDCQLLESDLTPVVIGAYTYTVRLATPVNFKIYDSI